MSQLTVASGSQVHTIERLIHMGRYAYCGVADEDVAAIIAKGATILAAEREAMWGVLMVDPEVRPLTLPSAAPNRAQVRALAMRHGPWLAEGAATLVSGLSRLLPPTLLPLTISTYATEKWLYTSLLGAGFTLADTVVYYRLDLPSKAAGAAWSPAAMAPAAMAPEKRTGEVTLRAATLGEAQLLAELDTEIFDPLWHFGAAEIVEMQVRGRVVIATHNGEAVGYSALLSGQRREAHLARLGVHPRYQGKGLGRQLLSEALHFAQQQGYNAVALNTQASNLRSQQLYTAFGFVPSGVEMPVLTLDIS